MATHRFQPTTYYNTIGSHEPALRVADGDTVITATADAGGRDERGERVAHGGNPQSGPFFVEGAEPGDTLVVEIVRLSPNRDWGYTATVIAENVLDPSDVRTLPPQQSAHWRIDRANRTVALSDPAARWHGDRGIMPPEALRDLVLPLVPMVGCFGVAPAGGEAISTATSARHGGNMDYRGFTEGVTVYLPVAVPGALFHIGDGHALQGDGEIVGTGIETSFEMEFTLRVRKGKTIGWPRGENADDIFTVGNARPLDQAVQHATSEMLRWLGEEYGLDATAASLLMGQTVRYDLGNIFDPAYTMVCKMPKRWLSKR
ncbi:MAG: acetamidase/formamidase family protein [Thermomicrobia bacterium]|nr:acetamidase/formamidase family protein [Thermomicrobia bacterium]